MGYEAIVTLPDGTKAKGKLDSILEGMVTAQFLILVDLFGDLVCLKTNMDNLRKYIKREGEHPDLFKEFPTLYVNDEYMYLLCNGTLFLRSIITAMDNLLNYGLKQRQISKYKHKIFKEHTAPIREFAETVYESLKKDFN